MNIHCGGGAEAARQAHNLEVGGASPSHATNPERKHTKSKPGTADGQAIVRRSTTGTGVRVGQTPPCLRDRPERRPLDSLSGSHQRSTEGDSWRESRSALPFFMRRFLSHQLGRSSAKAPAFFKTHTHTDYPYTD